MARHNQNDGQPQSRSDALRQEAQRLAKEHKIPYDRLLVCLTRLAEAFAAGDGGSQAHLPRCATRLMYDVISALGEESGIGLLERADLLELERRIRAVEYLRDDAVPFWTLGKLQAHLRDFLAFVEEIKAFLVQTGLPPRTLTSSPWLFLHLGRLYDTRRTSSPYPQEIPPPHGFEPPPYVWAKYATEGEVGQDEYEECEYRDADLLPGMAPNDAERLEAERPRFLAARSKVIQELARSCDEGEGGGLLERSLAILDDMLSRDTITFLLQMDVFYLGGNAQDRDSIEVTPKMSPGGLTNLLEVVGHVENELRTRLFDQTMKAIPQSLFEAVFESDDVIEGYLIAAQGNDREVLNAALDQFCGRSKTVQPQWTDFTHRLAKWLDPDFRVEVPVYIRPEYALRLAPFLKEYALFLESKADRGEPLVEVPPTRVSNVFRCDGSSWTIAFESKTVALPHLDGYFYIAQLLKQPGSSIDASELRRCITAWKTTPGHPSRARADRVVIRSADPDTQSSEALAFFPQDAGTAVDEQALNDYQAELALVERQLASAKGQGEGEVAAELQDKRDKLASWIKACTDHHGRPRRQSATSKQASDAVRNAINRAIASLESALPSLHTHLSVCLSPGASWRYAPPTPVDWAVTSEKIRQS